MFEDLTKHCPICSSTNIKQLEEYLNGNMFITKYICLDCTQIEETSNNTIHTSTWEVDENGSQVF